MIKKLGARMCFSVLAVNEWGEEQTESIIKKQLEAIHKNSMSVHGFKRAVGDWEYIMRVHPDRYNEKTKTFYQDESVWEYHYERDYETD